jgi:predicted metal-dependent phosphoesterase TrpH
MQNLCLLNNPVLGAAHDAGTQVMIDLHSHTTESDGTLSPPELVQLARAVGVEVLAITDHDTFNGYDLAAETNHLGLELICGIELSTRFRGRSVHLLGYFIKGVPPELFRSWIASLQASRELRNQELIARLESMGINITMAEVQQRGKKVAGRPHFAQLLVEKNYAASIQDAFDKYLGEAGACFVSRDEPPFEEAVERIVAAGGVPSLAHPARISREHAVIEEYVREMTAAGLRAIEIYHSDHSPGDVSLYRSLADAFALAMTGGSDFHGSNKPDIRLGTGRNGNVQIDVSMLQQLRMLS